MGPAEQPPEAMIAFVARQLGVRHVDFANYAQRDQLAANMPSNCKDIWACGVSD